jgi:hypothetical protein
MMASKRIGITLTRDHTFSNGMNQNAIYLYLLIKHSGYECDLLSYDEAHTEIVYNQIPVTLISLDTSKFNPAQYSTIITVTTSLDEATYKKCKEHGTTVIGYVCTNSLCMAIEAAATAHSREVIRGRDSPIDKAWVLDAFPFMKTYTEVMRGVKAQHVPHVWSSSIMEYYCRHVDKQDPAVLLYNPSTHTRKKLTLVIAESNVNFVKTAVVPLMAAEKLHTLNPDLIDEVYIFSYPMESKSLNALVNNMSVGKKVRKFQRKLVSEIFTHFNTVNTVPVFATHQIYTPLNYSYYELMYYGFPFVHNSPILKEYGHFYPEIDIDMCAVQILKAYQEHNNDFDVKLAKNREYLELIDPAHERCRERWRGVLSEL